MREHEKGRGAGCGRGRGDGMQTVDDAQKLSTGEVYVVEVAVSCPDIKTDGAFQWYWFIVVRLGKVSGRKCKEQEK